MRRPSVSSKPTQLAYATHLTVRANVAAVLHKEWNGKAAENSACKRQTGRAAAGHGRGRHYLHGRRGVSTKRQGSAGGLAHAARHHSTRKAYGCTLSIHQEISPPGRP